MGTTVSCRALLAVLPLVLATGLSTAAGQDLRLVAAASEHDTQAARALVDEPPARTADGGFIAQGYSDELDESRTYRDEGRRLAVGLQKQYAEATGITSLDQLVGRPWTILLGAT